MVRRFWVTSSPISPLPRVAPRSSTPSRYTSEIARPSILGSVTKRTSPISTPWRAQQRVEVEAGQLRDARLVGEVEVQWRDGDAAVGDRREVGAVLVVVARQLAIDAVAAPAVLLLCELHAVVVDALAEPTRARPAD